jgi:mRNA interferase HigB
MRVISKRTLREFWEKHTNAEPNLLQWYQRTSEAAWKNLAEVRQVFLSADIVGNFTIFNISGNNYRLITFIDYEYQLIFIRCVLTHAEYNKENWKNDSWFKNS